MGRPAFLFSKTWVRRDYPTQTYFARQNLPTTSWYRQNLPSQDVVNEPIIQLFQVVGAFCLVGNFGPTFAAWFNEQNAPGSQNDVGSLE